MSKLNNYLHIKPFWVSYSLPQPQSDSLFAAKWRVYRLHATYLLFSLKLLLCIQLCKFLWFLQQKDKNTKCIKHVVEVILKQNGHLTSIIFHVLSPTTLTFSLLIWFARWKTSDDLGSMFSWTTLESMVHCASGNAFGCVIRCPCAVTSLQCLESLPLSLSIRVQYSAHCSSALSSECPSGIPWEDL